jgi:deoxycytidine triphosphate deaminase
MMNKQGVLTRLDILHMQENKPPLIAGAVDLEEQIQPNGIDLTVRDVSYFSSRGKITASNRGRELSTLTRLEFGVDGRAPALIAAASACTALSGMPVTAGARSHY